MSTEIFGWVQVNTREISHEDRWLDVMRITMYAERNYDLFCELFGACCPTTNPRMAHPGLPGIMANPVRDYMENALTDRNSHDFSWVTFAEIREGVDKYERNRGIPGWHLVFSTMRYFAGDYGEENVMLVVGFDQ